MLMLVPTPPEIQWDEVLRSTPNSSLLALRDFLLPFMSMTMDSSFSSLSLTKALKESFWYLSSL